jgi:hypothetical protein
MNRHAHYGDYGGYDGYHRPRRNKLLGMWAAEKLGITG